MMLGLAAKCSYSAGLMRYLNSRIQSCYCAPIIWVFAPKNRETERVTLAMGDGRGLLPLIGRQGTTESVTFRGTATVQA